MSVRYHYRAATAAGQLVDRIKSQQNAGDEEGETTPILEIVMPAGRHDQRQNGKNSQQKDDPDLRNLLHGTRLAASSRAKIGGAAP